MNAWLITWDFPKVRDPFVAILSARKSDNTVAEFVEYYYLLMTSTVREVAYFANRPQKIPDKARIGMRFNGLNHAGRITCGNNPSIYARKVSDLVISHPDDDSTVETIKWKEPPIFQWDDLGEFPTLAQDGRHKEFTRTARFPVNDILSQRLPLKRIRDAQHNDC